MEEKINKHHARKVLEKLVLAGFSIEFDNRRSKGEILVGKDMVEAEYPYGEHSRERFYIAPKDWRFNFRWVHKGGSLKYEINKRCRGEIIEIGFKKGVVSVKVDEKDFGRYLVFELHEDRRTIPTKEAVRTRNKGFKYQGCLGSSCVFKYYTFHHWDIEHIEYEQGRSSLLQ